jgi:uncharacterized membrane protein
MTAIWRFVRATILGRVLFLTPIVVLGIVLSKAFEYIRRGLQPVTALIPQHVASGPTMTALLAILLLALACFLAGLFGRTLIAQRIVDSLEGVILSKVPGYEYVKQRARACSASARWRSIRSCSPNSAAHGGSGFRPMLAAALSRCSSPTR